MDLKKRCQWCGKYFIAHKMTTLYCSSSCIDKAYKAKKKQQIKEQVEEEQQSKLPIVGSIGQKPFLSPQNYDCFGKGGIIDGTCRGHLQECPRSMGSESYERREQNSHFMQYFIPYCIK